MNAIKEERTEPALLTVEHAGWLCGVGKTTAYEMCHADGPEGWKEFTLRIGAGARGLRVERAGLLRWIEARKGHVDPQDEEDGRARPPMAVARMLEISRERRTASER